MDEQKAAETKAVQTDRESQEYGSQHGQDTLGNETGSSSPTTDAAHAANDETTGEGTGARAGEYS